MSDYYYSYTENMAGTEIHFYFDRVEQCQFAVVGDTSDGNVTRAMIENRLRNKAFREKHLREVERFKDAGFMPTKSNVEALQ